MSRYENIKHIGCCSERRNLHNPAEMVYAEEWEKRNQRQPGLNSGLGILELLLNECITQRDAYIAATVVQWLGTNVGLAFITQCEDETKKRKKIYKIAIEFVGRMMGRNSL